MILDGNDFQREVKLDVPSIEWRKKGRKKEKKNIKNLKIFIRGIPVPETRGNIQKRKSGWKIARQQRHGVRPNIHFHRRSII